MQVDARLRLFRGALGTLGMLLPGMAAATLQCSVGLTTCIRTQGTQIPSKQVIQMLDHCSDFTRGDLGARALRMSHAELRRVTGGRLTPLALAWHAYGDLYDSPLRFERKQRPEDVSYSQIKRACGELNRDFHDDSRWTK